MSRRRKRRRKPVRGGAGHPARLANLRRGGTGNRRAFSHGAYARITRERLDAKMKEVFEGARRDAPLRGPDGGLRSEDRDLQRRAAKARRIRRWGFGSGGRFQARRFRCASSRPRPSMTTWIMTRELCTWVLPPPLGGNRPYLTKVGGRVTIFSGISRSPPGGTRRAP
jgi:hypothetical protein